MKALITQTHYCVPLTPKQWDNLNRYDKNGEDRWDEVCAKLKKAGAENIEYNGHFGMNIFFSLEKTRHLPRTMKAILKIVSK